MIIDWEHKTALLRPRNLKPMHFSSGTQTHNGFNIAYAALHGFTAGTAQAPACRIMETQEEDTIMRRPLLLIIILVLSFSQTDLGSPNPLAGVIFPLLFVSSLLLLMILIARRFEKNRSHNMNADDGGNAYFLSGKSGGDSGDASGD